MSGVSIYLAALPSPGAYARAWAKVKACDPAQSIRDPRHGGSVQAGVMLVEMRRALDNRINTRGGVSKVGWARWPDLVADARKINDSKRRIRWSGRNQLCDKRMARKYPEIHNPPKDD